VTVGARSRSTVDRARSAASSTPHRSSGVRCQVTAPSCVTWTALICSARTRVGTPAASISGRIDVGIALDDIGSINTTDRDRSASVRTITPGRRRRCSWPTHFDSLSSQTSPRGPEHFGHRGDIDHLGTIVGFVGRPRYPSRSTTRWSKTSGFVGQCGASGLGAAASGRLEALERPWRTVEPPGERSRHDLVGRRNVKRQPATRNLRSGTRPALPRRRTTRA